MNWTRFEARSSVRTKTMFGGFFAGLAPPLRTAARVQSPAESEHNTRGGEENAQPRCTPSPPNSLLQSPRAQLCSSAFAPTNLGFPFWPSGCAPLYSTLKRDSIRTTKYGTQLLKWSQKSCKPLANKGVGAEGGIRTHTPCGATPSRWCVYQFHHLGVTAGLCSKGGAPRQAASAAGWAWGGGDGACCAGG